MNLLFAFWEGRAKVLSKFPPKNGEHDNLKWVHGFHMVLEVCLDFAYEVVFCIFGGGRPREPSISPPENQKRIYKFCIGYMDFIRF